VKPQAAARIDVFLVRERVVEPRQRAGDAGARRRGAGGDLGRDRPPPGARPSPVPKAGQSTRSAGATIDGLLWARSFETRDVDRGLEELERRAEG
jgi:hypothetical protein